MPGRISAWEKLGEVKTRPRQFNTGGNVRNIILASCLLLSACSDEPKTVRTEIKEDGTKVEYVDRPGGSGGMMEHMASGLAAGAAAGAAGAASHRVTDHLINKHQERRAARQRRPRVYTARRR